MVSVRFTLRPLFGSLSKIIRDWQSPISHLQPVPLFAVQNRNIIIPTLPDRKVPCTLIPGDGIGPEMMECMQEVVEATEAPVEFETFFLSEIQSDLSADINAVVKSVRKNAVCIKGILSNPLSGDEPSLNYIFRQKLDLFANVVHIISIPGVVSRHKELDFIVVREQTEGEFSSMEHEIVPGVVECYKIVTEENSMRIAKFAFDYATKRGRKKVTAVHKANIIKLGDGLFLNCCEEMASRYPRIQFESMIIDNCAMQLTSKPQQFDVMVMGNLYGSIIDNVAAGLVGGAGIVAGASYSGEAAVFEPGARHTYSEAVGKDIANPTAHIICAAKMLHHVNLKSHARKLFSAIQKVNAEGKVQTKDVGGQSSTSEFTHALIRAIRNL